MIGSELVVGAAAEGIEALITDTTKSGSSSAIGSFVKSLKDKGSQVLFQASRKYIENYQKRHCQLKVLGMREPVDLSAVYTDVKVLNKRDVSQYEVYALEKNFRRFRFGGYSARHSADERYSGIDIANQKQYLMVLGGPGAGKSTFLRKIGLEALLTFYYENADYKHRLIPVLLELKRFDTDDVDIAKFIATEFETCGFPEAEKFAQNALTQGNLLVLLDGLDEVPSTNLNQVLSTIRDFVDCYDGNRFIASCRVAASGYRDDAFRRFSDVTMANFDDEQIQQFIHNWFGSEQDKERDTAKKCWTVLQKTENKASKELAHTPLLLTYLCLVYDLSLRFPNNRSRLYKKALRILLEEWAAEKRILRDDIYEGLSIEQEEILLSEIAYDGMIKDQLFFTKRKLSNQIRKFLASNLNAPKYLDSEEVLNAIEVQQGILVKRAEDTYSFSHLTLQEYLTAQYVVDNNEWKALVQKHLLDNRWRETFLLLPGLMTSRLGSDSLLLAMEEQASCFLCLPKLQKLMQWAELSTVKLGDDLRPLANRTGAIFLALSLSLSHNRALNHDLDRTLSRDFSRDLSFDRDRALALARDLDRALDRALTHDHDLSLSLHRDRARDRVFSLALTYAQLFERSKIFSNTDLSRLVKSLELQQKQQLDIGETRADREKFVQNFYGLWLSTLGIEAETIALSQKELDALANYFYACELMIRCKEGAVRVSPDVWKGIELRILTVPVANEVIAT